MWEKSPCGPRLQRTWSPHREAPRIHWTSQALPERLYLVCRLVTQPLCPCSIWGVGYDSRALICHDWLCQSTMHSVFEKWCVCYKLWKSPEPAFFFFHGKRLERPGILVFLLTSCQASCPIPPSPLLFPWAFSPSVTLFRSHYCLPLYSSHVFTTYSTIHFLSHNFLIVDWVPCYAYSHSS